MSVESISDAAAAYFVLAIGYNLVSLVRIDLERQALAPTDPVQGILIMTVLCVVHASVESLGTIAWTGLIAVFLLLIVRFGIWRHLVGYRDEDYSSRIAWGAAIAINSFGVCVLFLNLLM